MRVRRWENGGSGPHTDIQPSDSTAMELLPLKKGGMLFASADPAFGIIDEQARAKILQGPGQLDFRGRLDSSRVSKTGQTVEQGTNFPQHVIRFELAERRLDVDPPADNTLIGPLPGRQASR